MRKTQVVEPDNCPVECKSKCSLKCRQSMDKSASLDKQIWSCPSESCQASSN